MKEAVEDLDNLYGTNRKAKEIPTGSKEVDKVLKAYNPVTDYLYYPEADRKRSRLSEALIVALMLDSREKYHYQLRKFAHLWHTQTKQYGDTIVDTFREKTAVSGCNYLGTGFKNSLLSNVGNNAKA